MTDEMQFDQARSDAMRSFLVERVKRDTNVVGGARARRHRLLLVAVVASGAVAGVGAASLAVNVSGWIALPGTRPGAEPSFAAIPDWPKNALGQTFGQQGASPIPPDLIEVEVVDDSGDPIHGYVESRALAKAENGGPAPGSPAQALRQQVERRAEYPNGQALPVFKSDGETVVGTFVVGP